MPILPANLIAADPPQPAGLLTLPGVSSTPGLFGQLLAQIKTAGAVRNPTLRKADDQDVDAALAGLLVANPQAVPLPPVLQLPNVAASNPTPAVAQPISAVRAEPVLIATAAVAPDTPTPVNVAVPTLPNVIADTPRPAVESPAPQTTAAALPPTPTPVPARPLVPAAQSLIVPPQLPPGADPSAVSSAPPSSDAESPSPVAPGAAVALDLRTLSGSDRVAAASVPRFEATAAPPANPTSTPFAKLLNPAPKPVSPPTGFAVPLVRVEATADEVRSAAPAIPQLTVEPATLGARPIERLSPTPPPDAAEPTVARQLASGIVAHAKSDAPDRGEVRIQLEPASLGRVRIHLTADGGEVRGQLVVADESVRTLIVTQLPELRQRLEAAGVTVHQFAVSTEAGGSQGNTPDRGTRTPTPEPPAGEPPARRPTAPPRTSHRLDVTA